MALPRATKETLLGASDLVEREVELDTIGISVLVRSLPAAYSNKAQSQALEVRTENHRGRQEQTSRVNTDRLEALQVLYALVEPKLNSLEEAFTFAQNCGPAWRTLVDVIDEISGVNKKAMEETETRFQDGGKGEEGRDVGDGAANGSRAGRPDLPVRAGA